MNLPSNRRLRAVDEPLLLFEWLFSGDAGRENHVPLDPKRKRAASTGSWPGPEYSKEWSPAP